MVAVFDMVLLLEDCSVSLFLDIFSGVYPIFEYLDVQDPSFLLYTVISSRVRKCHSLLLLVSICKGLEAIYATSINLVHKS